MRCIEPDYRIDAIPYQYEARREATSSGGARKPGPFYRDRFKGS